MQELKSQEDNSVNFLLDNGLECRYVRRNEEKLSIYLSSQAGCKQACRFCFLTQNKDILATNASMEDYENQLFNVFEYYKSQPKAQRINFNLMAKGEPFANDILLTQFNHFYRVCEHYAKDLDFKINISSILPIGLEKIDLTHIYLFEKVKIYYSLYSLNAFFRRKWLPKAADPILALEALYENQISLNKPYRVHWAYIEGQNDSIEDTNQIGETLVNYGSPIVNIVRYNPFSNQQGKESDFDTISRNVWILKKKYNLVVRIIPRVGHDVYASCGMFL